MSDMQQQIIHSHEDRIRLLLAEIEWLTERSMEAEAWCNQLLAEIERLREADAKRFKLFQARNAKIEQLRVALQALLADRNGAHAASLARQALENEP